MKDGNQNEIGTDASAAGAAAAAAASAAAFVFTTVFMVVATVAAAEAAAVAAAPAAAPAAASVSEEKDSWTLNITNVLVFGKLVLHVGVGRCIISFAAGGTFRKLGSWSDSQLDNLFQAADINNDGTY